MRQFIGGVCMLLGSIVAEAQTPWPFDTLDGSVPAVIAHRGASGYLPEHTLEAYALAIDLGADYIEPDLVMTADGHLVVRHDLHLSKTTDVADRAEFADRKTTRGGRADWFVDDFTLEEIRSLRARQPFPGRDQSYDAAFRIPTFSEVLALAVQESSRRGRPIGVYPETKHPSYFAEKGLDMAEPLLAALRHAGLDDPDATVFIQSFEPEILRRLDRETDVPLILLLAGDSVDEPGSVPSDLFEQVATFADGVGPDKALLSVGGVSTGFVEEAHAQGLAVHCWTHRNDRLGPGMSNGRAEAKHLFALGVDGLFTDFPDTAVSVRALLSGAWQETAKASALSK